MTDRRVVWSRAALALALTLAAAAPALAQSILDPEPFDTPLGSDVYGFFEVGVGISYPPVYSLTTKPTSDGYYYRSYNKTVSFPGISAQIVGTPVWSDNGVSFEIAYDLQVFRWRQQTVGNSGSYSGSSTLSLNYISFSANYVRYFLPGVDRLYLLAGAGYMWTRGTLQSDTGGDGKTVNGSFANWRANAGIGYLHQWKYEEIGVELRSDFPLLTNRIPLSDSQGSFELNLRETAIIRLVATFGLGRLKNDK